MRALLLVLILTTTASAAATDDERAMSASLSALPEACLSRHHAGVAEWGLGRYAAASAALEGMLADCPSAAAALNLGAVRLRLKEFAAAARAFESAPPSARASYLLARAREGEGKIEAALAAIERAAAIDAFEPAVALRRAELLTALGRGADAEGELRRALKLAPDSPQALYRLSSLLRARDAKAEADNLARRYGAAPRARGCRYDDPIDPLESSPAGGPHWIEVEIDALKARGTASVLVQAGAIVARRGVARGRGKIRVPLGARARVDALRVDWSDGTHSHRAGLDADRKIIVREVDSRVW